MSGPHQPDEEWRQLTPALQDCVSATDVLETPRKKKQLKDVPKTAFQVLVAAKRVEKARLRAEENKKVGLDEHGKATSTLGPLAMQRAKEARERAKKDLAQDGNQDDFPLKELSQMPPIQAIRHALIHRAGSLKDAWLQFDRNNNGMLDMTEFCDGLKALRVPWSGLTHFQTIEQVFHLFDQDNSGLVDLVEFLGYPDDFSGDWKQKDDDATWRNYYTKVKLEPPVLSRKSRWDRPPLLVQKILDKLHQGQKVDNFEEQNRRAEVRKLGVAHPEMRIRGIGYHDMGQIHQVRMATLRGLEESRLRMENGLKDLAGHRAEFECMRKAIHEVTVETEAEKQARVQRETKEKQQAVMNSSAMSFKTVGPQAPRGDALVTYFHHKTLDLGEDDLQLRVLAHELGVPIPDVEKYAAMFAKYDTDGSGEIEKEEFGMMMQDLLCIGRCKDQELPKALLNDYWMSIDQDGSGAVDRDEFVQWYCLSFMADRGPCGIGDFALVSGGDTAMTVRRPGLGA